MEEIVGFKVFCVLILRSVDVVWCKLNFIDGLDIFFLCVLGIDLFFCVVGVGFVFVFGILLILEEIIDFCEVKLFRLLVCFSFVDFVFSWINFFIVCFAFIDVIKGELKVGFCFVEGIVICMKEVCVVGVGVIYVIVVGVIVVCVIILLLSVCFVLWDELIFKLFNWMGTFLIWIGEVFWRIGLIIVVIGRCEVFWGKFDKRDGIFCLRGSIGFWYVIFIVLRGVDWFIKVIFLRVNMFELFGLIDDLGIFFECIFGVFLLKGKGIWFLGGGIKFFVLILLSICGLVR